jgi:hypothetical protein
MGRVLVGALRRAASWSSWGLGKVLKNVETPAMRPASRWSGLARSRADARRRSCRDWCGAKDAFICRMTVRGSSDRGVSMDGWLRPCRYLERCV